MGQRTIRGKWKVHLDDMNAARGEAYARGEFEIRVIDGQRSNDRYGFAVIASF